jgi:hypothetical protein
MVLRHSETSARSWCAAAFLVALTGCSTSTRVADMAGGSLSLDLSPTAVWLIVDPGEPEQRWPRTGTCKKLSTKARATYNGLPLKRLSGVYESREFAYDRDCHFEFAFPGQMRGEPGVAASEEPGPIPAAARVGAAAVIQLADDSARWTFSVPDAFTPRKLMRISPPVDQALHRGDTVILRWSPATDVLGDKNIAIGLRPVERPAEGVTIAANKLAIDGDRLTFVIPGDVPENVNGPVHFQLLGTALVKPTTGPCPAASCGVSLQYSAEAASGTLAP